MFIEYSTPFYRPPARDKHYTYKSDNGKKHCHSERPEAYGRSWKAAKVITTTLEFQNSLGTLSFALDG